MTQDLQSCFQAMFSASLRKLVISKPRDKTSGLKKIEAAPFRGGYQFTRCQGAQAFHRNAASREEAIQACLEYLPSQFLQANAWDGDTEYILMVSKAGKISFVRRANQTAPPARDTHNRQKNYLLEEGMVIPPLIDMGVLTVTGQVVKSKYDKFKQINRFLELIDDVVKDASGPLHIIDFGCGKSYLTFVLYYYFTFMRKMDVRITGLDLKADVIERCNAAARKYGYDRLRFEVGDIAGYRPEGRVDMVVSLHACDTATDHALFHAVDWNAAYIFAVPCCQHELNAQVESGRFALLTRYGIVQERFAALLTDAMRASLLEHAGYKTQLLEFVDLSHTPKNLLIRAVKSGRGGKGLEEVQAIMQEFRVRPTLYDLFEKRGIL